MPYPIKNKIFTLFYIISIFSICLSVYFIFQKPAFPQPQTGKCGDGICDEIEQETGMCSEDCETTPSQPPFETVSLEFVKLVKIFNSARPEIVATDKRIFVFYLQPGINRKFIAKVFDKDMGNEISTKILVNSTTEYGMPTDIRLTSDGEYIYAFYETSNSYLFGAKYTLNDDLDRVAYTSEPITKGSPIVRASEGDEIVDDPAPLLGPDSIYVVTRIKSSLNRDGSNTIIRVREMDFNLNVLKKFDIDLSNYIDGETQQNSLLYHDGYFYLAIPSITEDGENLPYGLVSSEIVMVKFDKDWNIKGSNSVSSKNGYSEGYIMGIRADDQNFYLTYVRTKMPNQELVINLYDNNLDLLKEEIVKSASFPENPMELKGELTRPSIWLHEDKLYIGNNEGENAGVYIYKIVK